ncbi:MAG TPA: hypothetical protein PK472_02850 [Pseudomonadota bacterium]|nr:hypothetical protein [Pseudomonadota bacterium]
MLTTAVLALLALQAETNQPPPTENPSEQTSQPVITLLLAPDPVVRDQLAGGPQKGMWGVSVQAGYPWFSLRTMYGVGHRLAPLFELETALGRRFTTSLGLSLAWVNRPHFRLSGEVLLGWMLQEGELARRGPSGELRLRAAFSVGRLIPYLVLGTRHAILPSRTQIERESGVDTTWTVRHEWTPWGTLGLGIRATTSLGVDVAIDYGWVDAPGSVAIPGAHVGLHFGGGR